MNTAFRSASFLAPALLALACAPSPTVLGGTYEIVASLGETTLAGELELLKEGLTYRGRLTIMLGAPFNVALASNRATEDTVYFDTSSPATLVTTTLQQDTLRGHLIFGGNTVNLLGTRIENVAAASVLDQQVALKPFAPGIISDVTFGAAFPALTPGSDAVYYSSYDRDFGFQTAMVSRLVNGSWASAEVALFSGTHSDRSTTLSPDGTRIVFASLRPRPGETDPRSTYDLWDITRNQDSIWGEARHLTTINSDASDYQPSLTAAGALFFTSQREGGMGGQDIYVAHPDGRVENLGAPINTDEDEISAFVAPDGSYLIVATSANREGNVGNDDLYISFHENGAWTEPRNLGQPVNSFANEYGPFVSRDGEYLYFTSDRLPPTDIYRVPVGQLLMRR